MSASLFFEDDYRPGYEEIKQVHKELKDVNQSQPGARPGLLSGVSGVSEFPKEKESQENPYTPRMYSWDEVPEPKPVNWIAKGRLPRGQLSCLVGDEGTGKSAFWIWLAAHVTTGKPCEEFGIGSREPLTVVAIPTEEGWADILKPRLIVAGANEQYFRFFGIGSDGESTPRFPNHIPELEEGFIKLQEAGHELGLIVVAPWQHTKPGGGQLKDPVLARRIIDPWKRIAQTYNVAVLLVNHANRNNSANPRDKHGGTIVLRQAARLSLYAVRDEDGSLLIGPDKSNNGPLLPASRFVIESERWHEPTEDDDGMRPKARLVAQENQTISEKLATMAAEQKEATRANRYGVVKTRVLDYVNQHQEVSNSEVAEALGITAKQAGNCLSELLKDGEIDSPRRATYSPKPVSGVSVSSRNQESQESQENQQDTRALAGAGLSTRNQNSAPICPVCNTPNSSGEPTHPSCELEEPLPFDQDRP